ncbi:MAG: hypothetical protein ACR2ND_09530 [Solirubrobacteraceae bacterium]
MNRQEQPNGKLANVEVHGLSKFMCSVSAPEQAGEFYFAPFAAVIAAGARLMLAMLERLVTDAGGSYALCDTDSMAIVATRRGGPVPCPGGSPNAGDGPAIHALSFKTVDAIVARFETLNPYDPATVPGSALEIEPENYRPGTRTHQQLHCYAISAKRYCLYTSIDAASRSS